jgi:hypothetical protein
MSLPVLVFYFAWSSLRVDDAVIYKDGEPSFLDFSLKYCIHHHLECCWQVGEPKEHCSQLKQSFQHQEGCFPFISWFDSYVVVAPSYIELCEKGASC